MMDTCARILDVSAIDTQSMDAFFPTIVKDSEVRLSAVLSLRASGSRTGILMDYCNGVLHTVIHKFTLFQTSRDQK